MMISWKKEWGLDFIDAALHELLLVRFRKFFPEFSGCKLERLEVEDGVTASDLF